MAAPLFPPFPDRDDVLTVQAPRNRFEKPIRQWIQAVVDGFRDLYPRVEALEATLAGYVTAFTTATLTAVAGVFTTLSAASLSFPAVQVPSADANTLDDYEEGTFTPSLTFGGGATGLTYGTQAGSYTKIGNLVVAQIRIVLTAKGSSTGAAQVEGLPFATANDSHIAGGVMTVGTNLAGLTSPPTAYITANTTVANLADWGATGAVNIDDTNFANTSSFELVLTYLGAT